MKKFVSEDQIPPVRKDAAHKLMDILHEQQVELESEGSSNIVTLVEEARESKDPVVERLISKLVEMVLLSNLMHNLNRFCFMQFNLCILNQH